MSFKAIGLIPLFLFLQADAVLAQLSSFAQVSDKEIQLKECSFDSDADVVVLLDEAHSDYDDRY